MIECTVLSKKGWDIRPPMPVKVKRAKIHYQGCVYRNKVTIWAILGPVYF